MTRWIAPYELCGFSNTVSLLCNICNICMYDGSLFIPFNSINDRLQRWQSKYVFSICFKFPKKLLIIPFCALNTINYGNNVNVRLLCNQTKLLCSRKITDKQTRSKKNFSIDQLFKFSLQHYAIFCTLRFWNGTLKVWQ